jgi:multiple sugar transport system substrate-binding protein
MQVTSRRRFLELAGLGAAAAAIEPRSATAQSKSLTLLHESSFIKTYDEYFQQTLAPAYEKETGIKVNYELTSVGSLPTRITTISETGSGADVTAIFFLLPFLFDEKLLDVSDIADEIGKKQGGWYDAAKEAAVVNGKMEDDPVQQHRSADELAH